MKLIKTIIGALIITSAKFCCALTLMPLPTWMQGKEFTTLSVNDTVILTLRCSAAYDINRVIFEEFTSAKAAGLSERVEKYRNVSVKFSALLMKGKSKVEMDNYKKSYIHQSQEIYSAYFDAIKNSQPIPHSISNALLAGDIGACNDFDQIVFDAYKKIN